MPKAEITLPMSELHFDPALTLFGQFETRNIEKRRAGFWQGTSLSFSIHLGVLAIVLAPLGPKPTAPPPQIEVHPVTLLVETQAVTHAEPSKTDPASPPSPVPIQPLKSVRHLSHAPVQTQLKTPAPPMNPDVPPVSNATFQSTEGDSEGRTEHDIGTNGGREQGLGQTQAQTNGTAPYDAIPSYLSQIQRLIETHMVYPSEARKWRIQGVIHLRFTIGPSGRIDPDSIVFPIPSDPVLLRQGALQTLAAIHEFPLPPSGRIVIEIPLRYKTTGL